MYAANGFRFRSTQYVLRAYASMDVSAFVCIAHDDVKANYKIPDVMHETI